MGPGAARVQHVSPPEAVRDVAPGFCGGGTRAGRPCGGGGSADGLALGVQWHPENLAPEHPDHAAIFTWLVDAATGARSKALNKTPAQFCVTKLRFLQMRLHARTRAVIMKWLFRAGKAK